MGVRVREKVEGSGVWWVFVSQNRVRQSKCVGDRKAANAVASELRKRMSEGTFKLAPKGRMFETVAEEWLEQVAELRGIRPTTYENYRSGTLQHLIPYFGAKPLGEITTSMIEVFISTKRKPGGSTRNKDKALSRSSLRPLLVTLRMILQKAVKSGEIDTHPMAKLDRMPRAVGENVDPFTTDELRAILGAAREVSLMAGAMFRLWAQTGMRAGELSGLQDGDFDRSRGTVTVQRTYSRGRIGPPKRGGARTVSMLHPVADPVADWRPGATPESRGIITELRRLPVSRMEPQAFVFGRNGRPLESMELHRLWRRVIVKARVRYRSPEQFRHTFASTMLSRNAPLLYVQKQGGWQSATVMLSVYSRWLPGPEVALHPVAPSAHLEPVNTSALESQNDG
jgi:integrase